MSSINEECTELKNIKYKTMLMNGNALTERKSSNQDLANLDKFLEDNKISNQNDTWSKLDKTTKVKKIVLFVDKYCVEHNYSEQEKAMLVVFLNDCLDRKKLQRVKDVIYDKTIGEIKEIPSLLFNKVNNRFTLRNVEKKNSTVKCLSTKKTNGAITSKNTQIVDDVV